MSERSRIIARKREPTKQSIKVIKNRLLHATKVSHRNLMYPQEIVAK